MLDLSTISFKTETSDLERASKVIGELVTNVGKLDKAARDAAQTEVVFAKAAKLNADANLQNAKAQDVRLKSTITADKADQQATASIEKKTKATEKVNEVVNKNVGVLQRQKDILEFQTQGFSRGQSSILSYGKAAGLAAEDIGELGKVLETQRKLMGGDPFDKSLSGLKSLRNHYTELKEAMRQYATGSNLTAKQARELARGKEGLIEKMKVEGASFSEIRQAVRAHNTEYVNLATSYNKMTSAEDAVIKSRKEAVNATNYLTQADQKMAAALNTSNAALDKAGTDSLVKYETALRKSGVSQDVATLKLAKYKAQLEQVQIQEQKRREQHLAKALAPQATDVVVSLWSGQNPLTVLLQQGGQVTDLFMQSGVAAEKFGEVVKSSMKSMLPSILNVVKGVGGLLVDGFMAAGKAVSSFLANAVGMAGALDKMYMKMSENGPSKWGGAIQGLSSLISGVFAVGIAGVVTGLVALGTAAYQTMKEQDKLAQSLALYNGTLAVSHKSSLEYVAALNDVGVTTGNASAAITQMAKAGVFVSEDIMLVAKAAANLADYSDVAVEDTIKSFAKLKEKPVEALLEIAKQTGMVSIETIKMVEELQKAGKQSEASAAAMQAYADVTTNQVDRMKETYSSFGLFVMELGKKIKNFFSQVFKDIFYVSTESLRRDIARLEEMTAGYNDVPGYDPRRHELQVLKDKLAIMELESAAFEEQIKNNTEAAKVEEFGIKLREEANKVIDNSVAKTLNLTEYTKQYVKEKTKGQKVEADTLKLIEKAAEVEWKAMQKKDRGGSSKSENYFATLMRRLNNEAIGAEASQQKLTKAYAGMLELAADPRFLELTEDQKARAMNKLNEAHNTELATEADKKYAEGKALINNLLGKGEGLGKDYYDSMAKLESLKGTPGFDVKEIEAAQKALSDTTPFAKAMSEWFAKGREALEKYSAEFKKTRDDLSIQSDELDYQYSLLGKTEDQQKKITIEHQRQVKLLKAANEYEAERLKILNDKNIKNDEDRTAVMLQNDQAYAEKVRLINRETSLVYAQDLQKEFDNIRNGISDSIVTALFEGGKSGSKKLRNLVMAELRKPVTMVVNAVVNTILGNIVGSLMGGAAAGAAGGAAGGIGTSIAGSAAGGMLGGASSGVLGGLSQGFGATMSNGLIEGFGVNMSNIGTLAEAGEFSAALGAAAPYLLAVAALYSIISSFDDSGTLHTGGAASYSVATGQRNSLGFRDNEEGLPSYNPNDNIDNQFGTGFGYVETGKETISAMETLSKSLVEIFDGIAKTFGKTVGYEVAVAFADDTSDDGAWGAFGVRLQGVEILNWDDFRQSKWAPKEFGDGEEGYKQYLAAIAKDTRQVILDMDLPSWADQVLNDIGDAPSLESLSKAIQELAQMKSMYDLMTSQMVNFAGITDEAFGKLIKEFGDIGTMTNQVAGYYQNYYSEFERFNKAQADVTKSFTDLGLTMPTSREEFRKLAESQDLNTEAGRKMYAQLMALAASFGVVIDATEQLANARTDIVYRMMEQEAQLLDAQGRTVEADKKRRELLDKQRGAEYERLMKVNPELARLTAELWALEDAAVAAAKVKEIADTRQDLTDRILQQEAELLAAQGRTAEADKKRRELLDRQRARENERLMALNPELAKLAYELWLLEDATAAATRAAALEREISDNRRDYTDRILQQEAALLDAQGRTAEADKKRRELLDRQRARENERLMALSPELAKLAYELWLLEDATAAATRAAKERKEISDDLYNALVKAVDAEKTLLNEQKARLEETVSTLKAVFDILKSSVEDLYGEVSSTAAMQASEGRGVIAQAIATGILPDSKLLDTSIQAVRDEISNSLYVSKADADKARLIFAAQLALLKDTTEEQLTDAEKQLKAVNAQISYLDNILKTAKEQLDAFLGNTEVLKSVDKALADLYAFLQNPSAAKPVPKPVGTEKPGNNAGTGGGAVFGPGTGTSKPSTVNSDGNIVYADGSIGYRNSWIDNSGVKHYGFVSKDIWETERARGTPGYPAFANGGYYQGGMALVGEEGPELINFSNPGQVYTARQTASMLSGESSEVVAELKAVRSEIIMLRAEVRADVSHNAKTAKLLDRVIPEGDSVQVTIS